MGNEICTNGCVREHVLCIHPSHLDVNRKSHQDGSFSDVDSFIGRLLNGSNMYLLVDIYYTLKNDNIK